MLYRTRAYMLRQVVTEDGTQYFIDFKDGQGVFHELNVPYDFFMAFRRLELDNRKLVCLAKVFKEPSVNSSMARAISCASGSFCFSNSSRKALCGIQ